MARLLIFLTYCAPLCLIGGTFRGPADQQYAIVLGLGSIFNHASDPSLVYAPDENQMTLAFVALRDIPTGTELTVSYNQDISPGQPDWFQSMAFPSVD